MLNLMKKTIFLSSIALILYSCSSTHKLTKFRDKYLFSVELDKNGFAENISYNEVMGLIILPVEIDGSVYNFLFDTGSVTMVSSRLATKLKSINKSVPITIEDASGKENSADFGILPKLSIGNVDFLNIGVTAIDLSIFENKCISIDGIIGANLMRTCFWKIDYVNKKIYFSDQKENIKIPEPEMSATLFESFSGSPEVYYNWAQYAINATWDTGFNGLFQINDSIYLNNKKKTEVKSVASKNIPLGTLYGNSNTIEQNYSIRLDTILIIKEIKNLNFKANYTLLDVEAEVTPYPASALVGNKYLSASEEVLFDWKNKLVELKKIPSEKKSSSTFGFTAFKMGENIQVISLQDNSEVKKKGLKIGDIITSIYDQDVTNLSQDKWCEIFNSFDIDSQDIIWFNVKRGDIEEKFTVKKYNLFP